MTNMEQDRWSRVKGRLRSSVGEDVYSSWFARMDLESVQQESVHLSVPTRFLKSWIQAHYAERVLSCWQAELPGGGGGAPPVRVWWRADARGGARAARAGGGLGRPTRGKGPAARGGPRRTERTDARPAPE